MEAIQQCKNKFNFWVECDIEKGGQSGKDEMIVRGIASTADKDADQETLEPVGYILDRFLEYGFINYNHLGKSDASKIIGEPIDAQVTSDNKFFVKGKLYNTELGRSVYKLVNVLKKEKSKRKLGWSIEGRALERDPANEKRITKALITGVAITPNPINTNTYVDIVKGVQKEDFIPLAFSKEETKGGTYLLRFEENGKVVTLNRDFSIDIKEKSVTTEDAKKLAKESLKKKPYLLNYFYKNYQDGKITKGFFEYLVKSYRKIFFNE